MIKKIVMVIVSFAALQAYAQDGSVSPYSFFGLGDFRAGTTIENQMMGGIAIYTDSIHVNLQNPAAYGKLRLTAYAGGISHERFSLESTSEEANNDITNLEYLAIGFNVGKGLGVGLGIAPLTSIGYSILSESVNVNGAAVTEQYTGDGGLNRVFLSVGYELTKDLSIGATANFNFGTLNNQRAQNVENVQFGTFDNRSSRVNGVDFNYALNYTPTIKDKYTLYTSVRVNTQANLSSRNTQEIGSFSTNNTQTIELIDIDLGAQGLRNTGIKIPTRTTLGIGFGENKKWFLGAEYSFQALSSFRSEFIDIENIRYQDANSISLGGYFIPDYTSFNSYLKRITYRAGIRSTSTGMIVNDTEINDFGITFGVGLPLSSAAGGFSNVNLGFELGKRGTTDQMLIEENYFSIRLGLSLNDKWFVKRKIN